MKLLDLHCNDKYHIEKSKSKEHSILMNSEAELTVIKKFNICSSVEAIPVSHPHCSAF